MRDPNVDALILVTVPTLYIPSVDLASGLLETLTRLRNEGISKPFFPVMLAGDVVTPGRRVLEQNGVMTFETPDRAAKALRLMLRYRGFRGEGGHK